MTTRFSGTGELLDAAAGAPVELGVSDWVTLDQARIDAFAAVTGDNQWIHVDVERAKQGPFGTTIAHGYLTLALAPAFLANVVQVDNVSTAVNYGLNKVRFPSPVPSGSRVRGNVSLLAAAQRGKMVQVVFGLTVEIEAAPTPGCVAEIVGLFS